MPKAISTGSNIANHLLTNAPTATAIPEIVSLNEKLFSSSSVSNCPLSAAACISRKCPYPRTSSAYYETNEKLGKYKCVYILNIMR